MFLCLHGWAQERDALLMVHFGTTFDDTRAKTIDVINARAQEAFPQLTVREAYASPRVMKRLAAKGIKKDNAIDALLRLRAEGTRRVTVQPTFVIDGKEMDLLRRDIEQVRPFFDTIIVGTPLLYSVEDAERVCNILAARHPASSLRRADKKAVVFIGHGTEGPATALYSQLDYMLHALGHKNHHVSTIEGYPTLQTTIACLKEQQMKKVTLVPLLFVAGDHANIDISSEWKEALEKEGFVVDVRLEGLGEVPEIQNLYIEKARQ